jgi:hypothetical protein
MVSAVESRAGDTGSSDNLSGPERTALGALGGLIVGIATYPVGDGQGYAELFIHGDMAVVLGFLLRVLGTATLGAIWSYVHKPEHDPRRAFQLGIVAPAALAGVLYANAGDSGSDKTASLAVGAPKVGAPTVAVVTAPAPAPESAGLSLIGTARADTPKKPATTKKSTKPKPKESFIQRLIKGIVGK